MEKAAFSMLSFIFTVAMTTSLAIGEPRAQVVQLTCGKVRHENNGAFLSNINAVAESVFQMIKTQNYAVTISGKAPNAVYALAQCYGDLSLTDCAICISVARSVLAQCFQFTGGRIFLEGCFLRRENTSFFHEYAGTEDRAVCGNRSRKNLEFQETARRAVSRASSTAAYNNAYARVDIPVSRTHNKDSAYVLANCWKSLDFNSCRLCLENASASIQGCLPWSEGRALNTGCFMRYSDSNFLNLIPKNKSSGGIPTVAIAVAASCTVVLVGAASVGAYIWKRKRVDKNRKRAFDFKKMAKILRDSSLNFKYSTLEKATACFDEANKIGQGGFGTVYKGLLPDGREIAVKKLFCNNVHNLEEFFNEVNIVCSIEHKNLVRLLGCSYSGFDTFLIYEFLANKSLDHFIFDSNKGKTLDWEKRFTIIFEIAEGLAYLHENEKMQIIHRDIKASNILLDTRFHAKIADFGLARSFQGDKTHISTGIAGTLGYMAPEYLSHGKLTKKVDVYSLGVLFLEIMTGRRNTEGKPSEEYSKSLVACVWECFQGRMLEELIDPNLMLQNGDDPRVKNEISRVIHIALLCVQAIPMFRPSMSNALLMLMSKDEHLPSPTSPPFVDVQTTTPLAIVENTVATISQSVLYPR